MDFTALKNAITTAIKQNGNEEITGDVLQQILLSMVGTLGDSAINQLVTQNTMLQSALSQEASYRLSKDNQLQAQINGVAADFDNILEQVRQLIRGYEPIIIHGDVTNAPDEEDLTSNAQHLLQFKNNAYNPIIFSGMGKVFLRKNLRPLSTSYDFNGFVEGVPTQAELSGTPDQIYWDRTNEYFVGLKDGVYYLAWTDDDAYVPTSESNLYMYDGNPYRWNGSEFYIDSEELPNIRNVLTQDMINEANTIYIIRYDYTLKEDITIPEGCVLEFDGGSISGEHTITGANTGIQAGLVKIFNTDVTIAGSWNITEAYPEWFGAKGDGTTDDKTSFETLFNLASCCYAVEIGISKRHRIAGTVSLVSDTNIKGLSEDAAIIMDGGVFQCENKNGTHEVTAINITADIIEGTDFILVDSTSGLSIGDTVTILDKQNSSFYQERDYYRKGEMKVIKAIENQKIIFTEPFLDNYTHDGEYTTTEDISSVEKNNTRLAICKLNHITVKISDICFVGDGLNGCLRISMGKDCIVDNVTFDNTGIYGLNIFTCWNTKVTRCTVVSAPRPVINNVAQDSYGISVSNSYYTIIDACKTISGTHSISNGGAGWIYSVINRYIKVTKCFIDMYSDSISLDFHANNEYYEVEGNTINKGMSAGGDHSYIRNNNIIIPEEGIGIHAVWPYRRRGTDLIIQSNNIIATIGDNKTGLYMFDISPSYTVTKQGVVFIEGNSIIIYDKRTASNNKTVFAFRDNLVNKIIITNNNIHINQGTNKFLFNAITAIFYNGIHIANNNFDGTINLHEQGITEIVNNRICNAFGNAGIFLGGVNSSKVDTEKALIIIKGNYINNIGGYGVDARLSSAIHANKVDVYIEDNIVGDVAVTMTSRTNKILYQSLTADIRLSGNKNLGSQVDTNIGISCNKLILSEDNAMSLVMGTITTKEITSRKENAIYLTPYDGYIGIRTGYGFYGVVGGGTKLLGLNQAHILGSTTTREDIADTFNGYRFFDTTLNKMTYYINGSWFEFDKAKAGVKRSGTFSERPTTNDIYVGFQYFNTDTKKNITWDGSKWYNPDGTEATE